MKSLVILITMTFTLFVGATELKPVLLTNGVEASLSHDKLGDFPKIYKPGKLHLNLSKRMDSFIVRLYHPGIDHYSSDPELVRESENTYLLNNVFFILDGEWQIQIINTDKGVLGAFTVNIGKHKPNRKITTHAIFPHQTYKGQEYYNGKPTGQTCYVIIDSVKKNPKGRHCYDVSWRYASVRDDIPKNGYKVSSRITNYHRREYPNIKTCAQNVDGTTGGNEIYDEDTSILVNDIFNGMIKVGNTEFHHFLSIGKDDKTLYRSRIHGLRWNKEFDVDCLGLKLAK